MTFTNRVRDGKISFLFLWIIVFCLPFSRELFVIALWPWILFRLLEAVFSRDFPGKLYQRDNISIYFLPAFFLLLLLSVLWSDNVHAGMEHIGRSLLMIIFPLLLGTDVKVTQNKVRIRKLIKGYVFGASLALIFLWTYAIIYSVFFEGGRIDFDPVVHEWESAFLYTTFSFLIHPTYFGMMILMSATLCLNEIKVNNLFSKSLFWPLFMSTFFIVSLLFVSSRAMIGAAIAVIIYTIVTRISNKRILIISLSISIIALLSIASLHPHFRDFRDILTGETGKFSFDYIKESTDRAKTWQSSYLLIVENPILGVGIGDVKDSMIEKYLELGLYSESDQYLNCHNQFLETWLAVGIGGFLLLIIMLVYPLLRSNLSNRYLYGSFLLICLIACLFESVLNRLWGVAFFSMFYLFLTPGEKSLSDSG